MTKLPKVYLKREDYYCDLLRTCTNHLTGEVSYEILLPHGMIRTVLGEDIEHVD